MFSFLPNHAVSFGLPQACNLKLNQCEGVLCHLLVLQVYSVHVYPCRSCLRAPGQTCYQNDAGKSSAINPDARISADPCRRNKQSRRAPSPRSSFGLVPPNYLPDKRVSFVYILRFFMPRALRLSPGIRMIPGASLFSCPMVSFLHLSPSIYLDVTGSYHLLADKSDILSSALAPSGWCSETIYVQLISPISYHLSINNQSPANAPKPSISG